MRAIAATEQDEVKLTWPKAKPFRAFCSEQYYNNRDEYFAYGQDQPYTMEEYIRANMGLLKQLYRGQRKKD